jgi:hypothetical protein
MTVMAVKLAGVRIAQCVPTILGDGSTGTDAIIDADSLGALKASGLLSWSSDMPVEAMPAEWKNSKGEPLSVWLGHHYERADVDLPYIDPNARIVTPEQFGARGDGTSDDSLALASMFASLKDGSLVRCTRGRNYAVFGGAIDVLSNDTVIDLNGSTIIQKYSSSEGLFHLFRLDGNRNVSFIGGSISLSQKSKTNGSFAFATRCNGLRLKDVWCAGGNEDALKCYDCYDVAVSECRFDNFKNTILEFHSYAKDYQSSKPRPMIEGNIRIYNNTFNGCDDGSHGRGNGEGIWFGGSLLGGKDPIRLRGVVITGNTLIDCQRAIWSESNDAGCEPQGVVICNNSIMGTGASETKDGIGIIGCDGFTVSNNVIQNVGNFLPLPGADCNGIMLSATAGATVCKNGIVKNNVIVSDESLKHRMKYGVRVNIGSDLKIKDNIVAGAQEKKYWIAPGLSNVECDEA